MTLPNLVAGTEVLVRVPVLVGRRDDEPAHTEILAKVVADHGGTAEDPTGLVEVLPVGFAPKPYDTADVFAVQRDAVRIPPVTVTVRHAEGLVGFPAVPSTSTTDG